MFLSRLFSLFGLLLCLVVAFADVRERSLRLPAGPWLSRRGAGLPDRF